ncbi:MAG: carbohydrate ABC transporter substrate-binding protein, partial [Mesorhizobium sp.]
MRKIVTSVIAGIGLVLACGTSSYAQDKELTIFWAEWDPANYLQELVNDYTAETGVKVTVQTTPWPDFQTKAFTEFNAHGDAYDMVVGDSQWLGAGSTQGHYVDLTDFFNKHKLGDVMAPATVKYYAEYPGGSGKYWAIPLEGDAIGWSYRQD